MSSKEHNFESNQIKLIKSVLWDDKKGIEFFTFKLIFWILRLELEAEAEAGAWQMSLHIPM